ncbi:branched-chain amino acid ABC transporter permease [Actinomadura sp. 7K507]|uniref:branched-chain amino acid ABC transporter permease n=1 Tax=Actinomadura sp. 7K507 TaxID=2530365 RepID=UPI0014053E9F|nr:branched-chain amino acid ABC transporter permease [Actinomadura sp. 7K507]
MFDFLGYYNSILIHQSLIIGLLVISVLIAMQAGLLNLAPVGFMAFGAYTSALLTLETGMSMTVGALAGALTTGLLALLFAVPVLRLRGIYFAMGSLALGQAIVVIIGAVDFTGGQLGLNAVPMGVPTVLLVVLVVVACAALEMVRRSYVGRGLAAIRLDERTAQGLGVSAYRYRLVAFVISGALAGTAGALDVHSNGTVAPSQFDFGLLVVILTYVLVGGVGHWIGPVLVTAAVIVLREWVGLLGTEVEDIVYGLLLVVTMVLAPHGLSDPALWRKLRSKLQAKREAKVAAV